MRELLLAALIAICIWTQAKAGDWSKADYKRQTANTVLHLADWGQTLAIVGSPNHTERNPILGRNPTRGDVNRYMATTLAAHWLISNALKPTWRKRWQLTTMVIAVGYVGHNFSAGLRIEF
jgi:hypothetical protein